MKAKGFRVTGAAAVCALFLCGFFPLGAVEISRGRVLLSLHESTGRFSVSALDAEDRYQPFLSAQDPRTSFAALTVNDRVYRLGESGAFRFRYEENADTPALVFESPVMIAREEFSFIKTAGASVENGVRITFRIKNKSRSQIDAGLRLLLDTYLGETAAASPFSIGGKEITGETLIEKGGGAFWVSRNAAFSLMGSLSAAHGTPPDSAHFANWKRLNEAPWKADYAAGRNFNYLPYSIRDSAVSYYFDPVPLAPGAELVYTVMLASGDPAGFGQAASDAAPAVNAEAETPAVSAPPPAAPAETVQSVPAANSKEADLALLYSLMDRLDAFLAGEIEINEEDLAAMELTVTMLKARYNLP